MTTQTKHHNESLTGPVGISGPVGPTGSYGPTLTKEQSAKIILTVQKKESFANFVKNKVKKYFKKVTP